MCGCWKRKRESIISSDVETNDHDHPIRISSGSPVPLLATPVALSTKQEIITMKEKEITVDAFHSSAVTFLQCQRWTPQQVIDIFNEFLIYDLSKWIVKQYLGDQLIDLIEFMDQCNRIHVELQPPILFYLPAGRVARVRGHDQFAYTPYYDDPNWNNYANYCDHMNQFSTWLVKHYQRSFATKKIRCHHWGAGRHRMIGTLWNNNPLTSSLSTCSARSEVIETQSLVACLSSVSLRSHQRSGGVCLNRWCHFRFDFFPIVPLSTSTTTKSYCTIL